MYNTFFCRIEREGEDSFLNPESLTFDVRVDTDPRQVHTLSAQF